VSGGPLPRSPESFRAKKRGPPPRLKSLVFSRFFPKTTAATPGGAGSPHAPNVRRRSAAPRIPSIRNRRARHERAGARLRPLPGDRGRGDAGQGAGRGARRGCHPAGPAPRPAVRRSAPCRSTVAHRRHRGGPGAKLNIEMSHASGPSPAFNECCLECQRQRDNSFIPRFLASESTCRSDRSLK
jgi:hypothetical protein